MRRHIITLMQFRLQTGEQNGISLWGVPLWEWEDYLMQETILKQPAIWIRQTLNTVRQGTEQHLFHLAEIIILQAQAAAADVQAVIYVLLLYVQTVFANAAAETLSPAVKGGKL